MTGSTPSPARWVEVDTAALGENLTAVRGRIGSGVKVIAVIKANGYGHGYELTSRAFQRAGADLLAVTTVEEALEVRRSVSDLPILVFAPAIPADVDLYRTHRLIATVCDYEPALALSEAFGRSGDRLPVHLKIDTGMGRLGCIWTETALVAELLANDRGLEFAGIYTHFATASEPHSSLFRSQLDQFSTVLEILEKSGHRPPMAHAANSAAVLSTDEAWFDAVRPGTVLYGQLPPGISDDRLALRPTFRFRCRVVQVKEIPAGWTIGYGAEHRCTRPTRVAVLPVGYADGLMVEPASTFRGKRGMRRWISETVLGRTPVLTLNGRAVPCLGRMAAQFTCVDVTQLPEVRAGDPVELPCRRVLVNPLIPRVDTVQLLAECDDDQV